MELEAVEPEARTYGGFEPAERLRREEYEQLLFGTQKCRATRADPLLVLKQIVDAKDEKGPWKAGAQHLGFRRHDRFVGVKEVDDVVATFGEPLAAEVAATHVRGHDHVVRPTGDRGVVRLDIAAEQHVRVVALLAVPVVSLMALWSLTTVTAVQDAWSLHQAEELDRTLSEPMSDLVQGLQAEREAAGRHLAAPASTTELTSAHERTTAAATALQTGVRQASANIANLVPELRGRVDALTSELARLKPLHEAALAGNVDWNTAYRAYTRAIDDVHSVEERITGVQQGEAAEAARLALGIGRVEEMLERQNTAATSAFAGARMSPEQHTAFAEALGGQHVLTEDLLPELSSADRDAYQQLTRTPGYAALRDVQARLLAADPAALTTIPPKQWRDALTQVTTAMDDGSISARSTSRSSIRFSPPMLYTRRSSCSTSVRSALVKKMMPPMI